jgi:phage-related minor tail protein
MVLPVANGKDLELALRIRADLKQGQAELKQLENSLEQTGQQAQQTNSQLGTTGKAIDQLSAKTAAAAATANAISNSSAAATAQVDRNAAAMQRAGLSAGQYQQAMRLLPMQMTDVVTSLASGMPVWMVAIQQGGQLRDSFGGIGNAARAVVGTINPVTLAIGGLTAAAGALILAYYEGSQEAGRYNQALILTGGYAGVTAGQLASMAREMDNLDGVTQSSAAAALTQVTASGQFAGEQVKLVAVAAEQMRASTGTAIEDTIAEFAKLRNDPVKAILELNDKYHFLTRAQLDQINTLKDQGREQEAATEAMRTYAAVIADRTPKVTENLGWIERKWRDIQQVAKETVDGALSLGRAPDDTQRLTQIAQRLAYLRDTLNTGYESSGARDEIAKLSAEQDALLAKQQQVAKQSGGVVDSQAERARQEAEKEFDRLALSNLDKKAQLEREIADIRKLGLKAGKDQAEIDKQVAAARARYEESLAKPRKAPAVTDDAATRMLQQLRQQEAALRGQLDGTDKLTEAQRQQVQFAQLLADLKSKSILTADQKSLLANQDVLAAQLAQNVALDAQIQKRQQLVDNARANAGLQADYLRAIGRETDAAMLEIQTKYDKLRQSFQKDGNSAGLSLIDQLIPVEQAKVRLDDLQRQIDKMLGEQQRQEQSINVQQDAGLMTELDARQRIYDLHKQTYAQLQQIRPVLEQMDRQPGAVGEAARVVLNGLDNEAARLNSTLNDLQSKLRDGLSSGLNDALTGLANGTMNLRDAITSLGQSVADAMLNMASKNLAESATKGLMGLFGAGQADTTGNAASMTTGAAAVTSSASALAGAGSTLLAGAAAIEAAAVSLAAANGQSAIGGVAGGAGGEAGVLGGLAGPGLADSIGAASKEGATEMGNAITSASTTGSGTFSSVLDSVFSGGADLFGSLFDSIGSLFGGGSGSSAISGILGGIGSLFGGGAVAAATGGHVTGPGTTTSDSIPAMLSNWEYVTRAAVVQQPGALDFLHAFNARGMAALDDYARRVRHATGGLAGIPAPALPPPSLGIGPLASPAASMGATVQNAINLYAVQDEAQVASMAWSKPGQDHFMVFLQRNAQMVRSVLKVK